MRILDDFKKLNLLDEVKLKSFISHLNENAWETPSDYEEYEEWCRSNSIDVVEGKRLLTFITFVADYVSDQRDLVQGLNELKNELFGHIELSEEFSLNWKKLQSIIHETSNFILKTKEKWLRQVTKKISQFNLVCDIRPVFDLKRENVLNVMYPVILSLRHDQSTETFTYEVSEDTLREILAEVEYSLKKIEILKRSFQITKEQNDG